MNLDRLKEFLIYAKQATYASQGDDATVVPLLNGSKQLEYSSENLLYRDIYWGMAYFIGQEVVELENKPVWSMVYSGGTNEIVTSAEVLETYGFLRKALRLVNDDDIYRGPSEYKDGSYFYLNEVSGQIDNFWGHETIRKSGRLIYELRYSGGIIK
jgi:hypothetical protein